MPLYEYQCIPNRHRFEVRHGMMEDPISECPECGADVRRVIQPVGVVFKGSGFYVNDSRKSNSARKPAEAASSESKPESSGETKPSESKPSEPKSSEGSSSDSSSSSSKSETAAAG